MKMVLLVDTEVCVSGRARRCHVMSCLFSDDQFPSSDRHRAYDQHAAEERGFDELAQELGDTPAAQVGWDKGQVRICWRGCEVLGGKCRVRCCCHPLSSIPLSRS